MSGLPAEPRRDRRVGIVLLVAVIAGHAAILLRQPLVGAAENGDFWRVMRPAGIVPLDAREAVIHQYVSPTYGVSTAHLGAGFSSAALLAVAAKALGIGMGAAALDIRQVGAVYLLLYALALALAMRAGVPALLCALLAWAALDVSYSLYCNSFFADPAALLGVLAVALALLAGAGDARGWMRPALLNGAALLAGFSKNLYMLTPFVVAAAVLARPMRPWAAHLRAAAPLLVALLLAGALTTWHFTAGGGYRFPDINNHHVVFRGVAEVADDPARLLAELGVDPGQAPLVGRAYFELNAAERDRSAAALRDLSRVRVVLAYARDPRRVTRALPRLLPALRQTTAADPSFADRARPPAVYRGWWQFARLRGAPLPLVGFLLGVGLLALARAALARRWDGRHAALSFLFMNAVVLVIASVLGDGFFGLPRHLMGARFSIDLALALILYGIWLRLRGGWPRRWRRAPG
ncbi:hypothetical protein KF840_01390 [bacterium]|nr:hypothetical protein [bacterium]